MQEMSCSPFLAKANLSDDDDDDDRHLSANDVFILNTGSPSTTTGIETQAYIQPATPFDHVESLELADKGKFYLDEKRESAVGGQTEVELTARDAFDENVPNDSLSQKGQGHFEYNATEIMDSMRSMSGLGKNHDEQNEPMRHDVDMNLNRPLRLTHPKMTNNPFDAATTMHTITQPNDEWNLSTMLSISTSALNSFDQFMKEEAEWAALASVHCDSLLGIKRTASDAGFEDEDADEDEAFAGVQVLASDTDVSKHTLNESTESSNTSTGSDDPRVSPTPNLKVDGYMDMHMHPTASDFASTKPQIIKFDRHCCRCGAKTTPQWYRHRREQNHSRETTRTDSQMYLCCACYLYERKNKKPRPLELQIALESAKGFNIANEEKVCYNCGGVDTPAWHVSRFACGIGDGVEDGDAIRQLICNACKNYERRHGLPRPKYLQLAYQVEKQRDTKNLKVFNATYIFQDINLTHSFCFKYVVAQAQEATFYSFT
jgi:ribosomal protein S27AE